MSASDTFGDFQKSKEEEFFHQKEKELIAKMRERTEREAERREMGATVGVADEEVLTLLQDLGFTRETVSILHLVPLIQVAWADGSVSSQERALVHQLAEQRGLAKGSPGWEQLDRWLTTQPSKTFFETSLRIIQSVLNTSSPEGQSQSPSDLVDLCLRVAQASGGFLGFGNKISDEERAVLDKISAELTKKNPSGVQNVVGETKSNG